MKRAFALAVLLAIPATVFAQTDATTSQHKSSARSGAVRSGSSEIQQLRDAVAEQKDAIAAQQQQIQQMQRQIQSRDQAIQTLQQRVDQADAAASQAQQTARSALSGEQKEGQITSSDFISLQHDVTDLKAANASTVESLTATEKRVGDLESPLAIHFKGITLTPGGFLAADTVWRQRAMFSDIGTQFNAIPFSAAGQARASDFYGSGRASRMSLLAKGNWGETVLTGYYEADFLGVGVASTNNQSNSYVLRQRQLWSEAAFHNGWSVAGGQMWSLATEFKSGLDPFTWLSPQVIDTQYNAGFSYLRQYGVRVTKDFNDKVWFGMSVENAQTLLTVSGNPTNISPDFVAKLAFEPGFGHYEIFGVASIFRTRIYPNATASTPSAAGAFNNNTEGGGFGANARWLVAQKHLEIGIHYLGGNGVGRYGVAQLPDTTVYGNGFQHLVRSYQGLFSVEYHAPKWDLNLYGGVEAAGRQASLFKGKPVGYGSPLFVNTGCGTETLPTLANGFGPGPLANCSANTRAIFEGTAAFFYKPYNGPD